MRPSSLKIASLLAALCWLSSCSRPDPNRINAEGYGGTDQLTNSLEITRKNLMSSVMRLSHDPNPETLCMPVNGPDFGPFLRKMLVPLDSSRQEFARAILLDAGNQVALFNQAKNVKYTISESPLLVNGVGVDAMTPLSSEGAITFSRARLVDYGEIQIMAIWTHELLHQIVLSGKSTRITDTESVGPFQIGSHLLDTLGACLAAYTLQHAP